MSPVTASWGWGDELTIRPCKRLEVGLDPPGHPPAWGCGGHVQASALPCPLPPLIPLDQPGAGYLRAQGKGCEDTKEGLCRETCI